MMEKSSEHDDPKSESDAIPQKFEIEDRKSKYIDPGLRGSTDDLKDNPEQIGSQANLVTNRRKSTPFQAKVNLFKGFLGVGILALPYSFNQGGYALSSIVMFLISILSSITMKMMFEVCDHMNKPNLTYEVIAERVLGSKGNFSVQLSMVIFQCGCCISYIIFFMQFFENAFGTIEDTKYDILYLTLALCIIAPMSLFNDITLLAKFSIISNLMISVTLLAIIGYNFELILNTNSLDQNEGDLFNFQKLPMLVGVCIFAFEAIGVVFNIRNSLAKPSDFGTIYTFINTLVSIIYIGFATLAVLAMGTEVKEIMLFSLPTDRNDVKFFQVLYAFALALTYPLQILPAFNILEHSETINQIIKPQTESWKTRRFLFRSMVTLIICMIAFGVPRFAVFLNIIGGICGTLLQFIFPVFIHQICFPDITTATQVKHYSIVSVGVLAIIFSTVFSAQELVENRK